MDTGHHNRHTAPSVNGLYPGKGRRHKSKAYKNWLAKPATAFVGWDKPVSGVALYEVLKNAAIDKHGERGAVL